MNESHHNTSEKVDFADTLSYFEIVILAVIMASICAVTVVGNTLVVISFIVDRKLRTLTNYFILSLAVSDSLIACISMPFFTLYLLSGEWTLGPVLCDMWLAQDYMCSSASGLNLLMISFDRYFSVTSPLRYRARRSGKHVASMISCVWILSFIIWPPWIYAWPYIGGRRTVPEDDCYVQFLETNSYLTVLTAVLAYYIPVIIMCVLYHRIWKEAEKRKLYLSGMETRNTIGDKCLQPNTSDGKIKSNAHPSSSLFSCLSTHKRVVQCSQKNVYEVELLSPVTSPNQSSVSEVGSKSPAVLHGSNTIEQAQEVISNPQGTLDVDSSMEHHTARENVQLRVSSIKRNNGKTDNKAARMLTAILLAFIITATPYNVLVLVKNFDYTRTLVPDAMWYFCYFLFYINSSLNPVCYALANSNFRKTYWRIFKCSWNRKSRGTRSF